MMKFDEFTKNVKDLFLLSIQEENYQSLRTSVNKILELVEETNYRVFSNGYIDTYEFYDNEEEPLDFTISIYDNLNNPRYLSLSITDKKQELEIGYFK